VITTRRMRALFVETNGLGRNESGIVGNFMGETKMETHLLTPRRFSAAPVFGMTFTMMDIQNEDFPGARIDSIILDVGKHMHDSAEMNADYALVMRGFSAIRATS
jgi:hypothetical protein